uniref:SWIB domain-containing protein n=1 Tax=Ascaris lumbricoides TaxID=6252 RepID=A0A0M3HWK3_ASCLU
MHDSANDFELTCQFVPQIEMPNMKRKPLFDVIPSIKQAISHYLIHRKVKLS